ncbi:MAG: hypothetical protein EOO40_00685 [Deltaproteobacteria bacterium]|nr:MAG: hypothetical protein EOO40_00685 [Deltaproteobacteria bacterium]
MLNSLMSPFRGSALERALQSPDFAASYDLIVRDTAQDRMEASVLHASARQMGRTQVRNRREPQAAARQTSTDLPRSAPRAGPPPAGDHRAEALGQPPDHSY